MSLCPLLFGKKDGRGEPLPLQCSERVLAPNAIV
jgi:hypothetical protein